MKQLLLFSGIILLLSSCSKWKDDSYSNLVYYTEDFKEMDFEILGYSSNDIDALWFEFYNEEKKKDYNKYALVVKSNGEFKKELGSCNINWANDIDFMPTNAESYDGDFIYEKEKFTVDFGSDNRTEELIFVYKETGKKCKKGEK